MKLLLNLFYNIFVTRSQFINLSKDELIDRLLQVENIEDKLEHLNKQFDDFLCKYKELYSELQTSKIVKTFFLIELSNWKKMRLVKHITLEGK